MAVSSMTSNDQDDRRNRCNGGLVFLQVVSLTFMAKIIIL